MLTAQQPIPGIPPAADCLLARGSALAALDRHEEALAVFLEAAELAPGSAQAFYQMGKEAAALGHRSAAVSLLEKSLNLDPAGAEAYRLLAMVERAQGRHAEAERSEALALLADVAAGEHTGHEAGQACFELGLEACKRKNPDAALPLLRKAVRLHPSCGEAHHVLGSLLDRRGDLPEALQSYQTSVALLGPQAPARRAVAATLAKLGDPNGLDLLERLVGEAPKNPDAHFRWSEALLLHGRYGLGWREYEWRTGAMGCKQPPRSFDVPRWEGQDLRGQPILLYAEQGFGDTLQFARYVPLVAARGGAVLLEVQPQLQRLLAGLPGVAGCFTPDEPKPAFCCHASLMSLPWLFGTELDTIPPPQAPTLSWTSKPGLRRPKLQAGLVWSGNPKHSADHTRSARLSDLLPLAAVPGIEWTALQVGPGAAEIETHGEPFKFRGSCAGAQDFFDTAALVSDLDLVIAVDTSVAHLAGTLGKPVWILLPQSGDWRWGLRGDSTAWYPSARLFRQTEPRGRLGVVERAAQSLKIMAADASG